MSPDPQPCLAARQVSKAYGATRALDSVDFTVAHGEIHALLGENGAGKSTLVKILSGIVKPDSGIIELEGEALGEADDGELGRCSERSADERAEHKDEWCGRLEWIDTRRRLTVHQVRSETSAAEKSAQHALMQRHELRRATGQIHSEISAVVTKHGKGPLTRPRPQRLAPASRRG
mgnify:CR=1 FL=1